MHRQRRARLPRAGYSRRAAAWTGFLTFRQGISSIDGEYVGKLGEHGVDLIAGCRPSEAEADGTHAYIGLYAHRFQDRRQLDTAGMACRPRRGGYIIEPRQYLGANPADE